MRRVILRFGLLCLVLILTFNIFCGSSYASTTANTGLTGLWEYPTAEMPEDGIGHFGYTKASPYAFYFIDIAWLPWLEINTRLSAFTSVETSVHRRYLDKAMDVKAILWHSKSPKNWIMPSIAFGVVDAMGTELMKAWYGAATWRVGKFAATIGYGTDRLNGIYGGIEWDIANWLTFKAEYSPLDYANDKADRQRILTDDKLPSSKYNAGIVLKTPWGMNGSVSYQRGNEWVFSISQRINLKGPFFGSARKNYKTLGDFRCPDWENVDSQDLIARIKSGIEKYIRVRDVDIKLEESDSDEGGRRVLLSYENYGYSSHAEAMTRVLVVLSSVMPETDELILIHKNSGTPVVKAVFPGLLLFDIRSRTLRGEDLIHSAVFTWASRDIEEPDESALRNKAVHEFKAMLVYEPRIDQTIREPYMDRLNIDAIYNGRYYNGWGSVIDVRFPVYTHADTTDNTGLWWEKDFNDKIRLQQAALTYANKLNEKSRMWVFGEGGYLDEEWAGGNLWGRYYGHDGRWWIGARFTAMHDRDPYSFAGLTSGLLTYRNGGVYDIDDGEQWRHGEWFQAGYHITDLDLDLQADYGRFIDGDNGLKVMATRHWDDTAIGFWYMDTDRHAPGRNMTKTGVHMELPADKWFGSWFGNSSSHIWEQNTMLISTWRVHSGREGGIVRTPERLMSQLRPLAMKRNVESLLRDYCSYDGETSDSEGDREVTSIFEYIFRKK